MDEVNKLLECLIASCDEAISGEWNKSDEGFEAMIMQLEQIQNILNGK